MAKMIIVGLGNPGKEYEHTYHNVGFLALERATSLRWEKYKNLFDYAIAGDTVFVKPLTYMNESGNAVKKALKKFGAKPADLTVIHDESDIPIGKLKVSFARNSAGHKGVQSIIDALRTNAFRRFRIGIRPVNEARRKKAGEFALKQITKKDLAALEVVFEKIEATA